MNAKFVTAVLFGCLSLGSVCAAVDLQSGGSQKSTPSKKAADSMTGCLDEQNGTYVLVDDRNLVPVANLEAVGFPTESFAKHVGQRVTVRGTRISGGTIPAFKVSSIEKVSDTCSPQK